MTIGSGAIHIDDLAALAVAAGRERDDSVIDAVGPERPTFLELVAPAAGGRAQQERDRAGAGRARCRPWRQSSAWCVHDVLLTGDEYRAMADGLADTDGPATGSIALSTWIEEHAESLGRRYANEIDRHFRRPRSQLQMTRTSAAATAR